MPQSLPDYDPDADARPELSRLPPLPSFGLILRQWFGHQAAIWLLLLLLALAR